MEINATIIGQLITFIILVWFTMKYVWPPITKAMQERQSQIAAGLEAAERGKKELEDAYGKALTIIQDAKKEAQQLIENANKRSSQIVEEAKEHAKQEAFRILQHAQEEISREITQAKEGLRQQLSRLAIAGAEKVIQKNLDPAAQASILNQFVAEI